MLNKDDYIEELKEMALASRLKRISDQLLMSVGKIAKKNGFSIQPKYYVFLSLLYFKNSVTIGDAAESLGVTQPAISQFSRELQQMGILQFRVDENDSRKKHLQLTEMGNKTVKQMLPMWEEIARIVKNLCNQIDPEFLKNLSAIESVLMDSPLHQRSQYSLKNTSTN